MKEELKEKLLWKPWVGENFSKRNNKLLLVGESHYTVDENGNHDPDCFNDFMTNDETTINVIKRHLNGKNWNLFSNIYRALFKTSKIETNSFWSKIAFYNFIQRPMKTNKDRPSNDDFKKSYQPFFELISELDISHCIFLGNSSERHFDGELQKNSFLKMQKKSEKEKIGRYWATMKTITKGEKEIKIYFIKHPSQYFSWEKWNEYLNRKENSLLIDLK